MSQLATTATSFGSVFGGAAIGSVFGGPLVGGIIGLFVGAILSYGIDQKLTKDFDMAFIRQEEEKTLTKSINTLNLKLNSPKKVIEIRRQ